MILVKKLNLSFIIIFLTSFFMYKKFGGNFINFIPNLILMVLLILIALKNKTNIIKSGFIGVLFIFITLMLSSIIWTDAPIYGLNKIITLIITILLFYIIFNTINNNYKIFYFTSIIFWIIYLINLYFEFGSFANLLASLDLRFRLGMEFGEATSTLHPISISRYLGFQILNLFIWLIIIKKFKINKFNYIVFLPLLSISLVYLFFSGTKTPILALILSISLFILLSKKCKKIYLSIYLIFLSIITITYLSFDVKNTSLLTAEQKTYVEYRFYSSGKATSDRTYQNQRALSQINEKNFLLGSGSGNFGFLYNKKDIRDYPHNIFSEILYENGIIAILIILLMFLYALYILKKSTNILTIAYTMLYLYFLFNSFFSGDLISNNLVFGFFIFMVLSHKYEKKLIKNKDRLI